MKSLKQQIACKCIHFNGLMNDTCKAGIKYIDVKPFGPLKLPCLQQGGHCDKSEFLLPDEVDDRVKEIKVESAKFIVTWMAIKEKFSQDKKLSGSVECTCGGKITYVIAEFNSHVWAKCNSCDLKLME